MNKKGIDISEWNKGKIDWPVAAKNIDFAILREGCRERADYAFFEYVQSCKKYNVPIAGVYHFIYATDNQKVIAEAESCLKNIEKAGLSKDIYVWCDFEYDTVTKAAALGVKLGPAECNLFTKTFCDFFERKGYKAGIYTNCDYYKNWYSKSVLDAYPIWLADYSGNPDYPCLYHQYTSSGAVVGISGKVDMNYFIDTKEETTMVRMSNCGHDENNRYAGGKAGDQSGTEWYLRPWYAYPWNYILRWKDRKLADLFADLAEEAAKNNLIGYDQNQRDTFYQHLKASNYRPSQITIACEADCSSGTIALIKAVGYIMGIKDLQNCGNTMSYTGNMMTWFRSAAGKKYFDILTGKYLTDSTLAKRGDINLNTAHHVNVTIDNGINAELSDTSRLPETAAKLNTKPKWVGEVTATELNVRSWAGTENPTIKKWPKLLKGNLIDVCDTIKDKNSANWYYVRIAGKFYGFVSAKYVKRS